MFLCYTPMCSKKEKEWSHILTFYSLKGHSGMLYQRGRNWAEYGGHSSEQDVILALKEMEERHVAFPLLKGSCWWGVGLAQSCSLGWTTAPVLQLKPPDVVAESFPSHQAAPGEAVPSLTLSRGEK